YQLGRISGFKREFSLSDTSYHCSYARSERVPRWALHAISSLAPAIFMPIINLVIVQSLWDLHNSWLGLTLSVSLTGLISNLVKVCVGRPRPDLISRCLPSPGTKDSLVWGLSNYTICTQTDEHILRDGFRSFPSGHASLAFAGLGFLSFYLAGKLRLWDDHGYAGKVWLALTPLTGASLVAITRTMDYRHHWEDVFVGSLLGLTIAFVSYRQFFPSFTHPSSQLPLPPRVDLSVNPTRDRLRVGQEEMEPLVLSEDDEA
ncbi:phosphatidic acid phosphatase type 2/haloperoxidase, partial [Gautieria morchelliformis]